jgi:hypothetical protein
MNFEVIYNRQFLVGVIILVISIVLYVCSKDIVKWIDTSCLKNLVFNEDKPTFRITRARLSFFLFAIFGLILIIDAITGLVK